MKSMLIFLLITYKKKTAKGSILSHRFSKRSLEKTKISRRLGGSFVGKTKVDGLLSVLDDEGSIAMFTAVEVSCPWYVVDNNHFTKDKKKLAKNLKLIINGIYKLNIFTGSNITKVKLYGIQLLYQK